MPDPKTAAPARRQVRGCRYWSALPTKIDVLAANTISTVNERETAEALQSNCAAMGFKRTLHA
jgi:hypothetical protein